LLAYVERRLFMYVAFQPNNFPFERTLLPIERTNERKQLQAGRQAAENKTLIKHENRNSRKKFSHRIHHPPTVKVTAR